MSGEAAAPQVAPEAAAPEEPEEAELGGRQLAETLDDDIRKAVTLEESLSMFGKHWVGDITGGLGTAMNTKSVSHPVDAIDDFLSHDWATPGFVKYITLSIVYNSVPATIVGIILSMVFGILQIFMKPLRRMAPMNIMVGGTTYTVDSVGYFGLGMGLFGFLTTLFLWQRVRKLFCFRSREVFMDKLCIHQTDPNLKAKGILGLAGFLALSDRLVVLWSPRYFTRLWCVYEIASWLSQRKSLLKIQMEPVAQGAFVACVMGGMSFLMVVMVWLARLSNIVYGIAMGVSMMAVVPLPLHIIRRSVRDLQRMPAQIHNFAFANAECFCCSVNHVIPNTGITIPCDRDVINTKLNVWFRSEDGTKSPEDMFNEYVRESFKKYILNRVGGSKVKYTLAVIATLPGWFFITDRFHILYEIDGNDSWRLFSHYLAMTFGVFPCILRTSLWIAVLFDKVFGVRENMGADILVTILAACCVCGFIGGMLFAMIGTLSIETVWPQLIVLPLVGFVTIYLFQEDLFTWWKQLRGEKATAQGSVDASAKKADEDKVQVEVSV